MFRVDNGNNNNKKKKNIGCNTVAYTEVLVQYTNIH